MNCNSSSSSSDDAYDDMVMTVIAMNASLEQEEGPLFQNAYHANEPNKKKRHYVERDRESANDRLLNDYFVDRPLYPEFMFRRRFRMRRTVFLRLVNQLAATDPYFQQRPDAIGRLGASPLQKCTAAIRMLAYGTSADAVDEYLKIAESTTRECLNHFVEGVTREFGAEYLRRPTIFDVQRLLRDGARRGFPGMMGSIDCMHWQWKNCPRAWKGMYQGRNKSATIILEAVASGDLWIWHAFFGTPGSCNDINVLQRSPVFDDIYQGRAPKVTYSVNGHAYHMGYYLTDGIYPKWAAFIPAIRLPQTPEDELFTRRQEAIRKDVERAFGVLQARFAIIKNPARVWDENVLWKIIMACIIMHNMIVEDERDTYKNYQDPTEFEQDRADTIGESSSANVNEAFMVSPGRFENLSLQQYMERRHDVHNTHIHNCLKRDLVQHIWSNFSANGDN